MPVSITLGRVTLALIPLMWSIAYVAGPTLRANPEHPLMIGCAVLSTVIAVLSPWLVLPVGSVEHATIDRTGTLTVPTVLGRRRIDLGNLQRVGATTVRIAELGDEFVLHLRGGRRWVLLWLGDDPRLPAHLHLRGELRAAIRTLAAERPDALSARARVLLKLDPRPSFARRFARGTVTTIVGTALFLPLYLAVGLGAPLASMAIANLRP